jgi:hypothetical protein
VKAPRFLRPSAHVEDEPARLALLVLVASILSIGAARPPRQEAGRGNDAAVGGRRPARLRLRFLDLRLRGPVVT